MKEVIETFRKIGSYDRHNLTIDEPWAFNGGVGVQRYRITIELIEEDTEVYRERLQKLWDENDNHHNWGPIRGEAKRLGVEIDDKL